MTREMGQPPSGLPHGEDAAFLPKTCPIGSDLSHPSTVVSPCLCRGLTTRTKSLCLALAVGLTVFSICCLATSVYALHLNYQLRQDVEARLQDLCEGHPPPRGRSRHPQPPQHSDHSSQHSQQKPPKSHRGDTDWSDVPEIEIQALEDVRYNDDVISVDSPGRYIRESSRRRSPNKGFRADTEAVGPDESRQVAPIRHARSRRNGRANGKGRQACSDKSAEICKKAMKKLKAFMKTGTVKDLKEQLRALNETMRQARGSIPHVHMYADVKVAETRRLRLSADENSSVAISTDEGVPIGDLYHQGFVPRDRKYSFWKTETPDVTETFGTNGTYVEIKQSGVYLIYTQVHYFETAASLGYSVMVNTEVKMQCFTGVDAVNEPPRFPGVPPPARSTLAVAKGCHMTRVLHLDRGDLVWIRDTYSETLVSVSNRAHTYWGLVRLAAS